MHRRWPAEYRAEDAWQRVAAVTTAAARGQLPMHLATSSQTFSRKPTPLAASIGWRRKRRFNFASAHTSSSRGRTKGAHSGRMSHCRPTLHNDHVLTAAAGMAGQAELAMTAQLRRAQPNISLAWIATQCRSSTTPNGSIIWTASAALTCSDILVLDKSGMSEQRHQRSFGDVRY